MIKEIKCFLDENIKHRKSILSLAVSSAKADTKKTTLGMYWNLIRDLVFFVTYGFFMMVVRSGSGIGGMPRLMYLLLGLVGWYFIQDTINQGVNCILKNKQIFTKIKFPILAIPTFEVIAIYIKRIPTLILMSLMLIVIMFATGFMININFFGLIYSFFAFFIFSVAFTLFFSGFYTISKDFRELYKSIARIQFYFVPIFWTLNDIVHGLRGLPHWVVIVVENLPFIHLVETFRNAIALNEFPHWTNIVVFLVITFILFAMGCYVQYRLRRIYSDFV